MYKKFLNISPPLSFPPEFLIFIYTVKQHICFWCIYSILQLYKKSSLLLHYNSMYCKTLCLFSLIFSVYVNFIQFFPPNFWCSITLHTIHFWFTYFYRNFTNTKTVPESLTHVYAEKIQKIFKILYLRFPLHTYYCNFDISYSSHRKFIFLFLVFVFL